VLGNGADPALVNQPAGDSMHGLPPPPTRPTATRMHSHETSVVKVSETAAET